MTPANLADLSMDTREKLNQDCRQMSEDEADQSRASKLQAICGDSRQALQDGGRDAVEAVRDRLDALRRSE